MNLLQQTRQSIADRLFINTLVRHRSRMGRVDAPRYTKHWQACRKAKCRRSGFTWPSSGQKLAPTTR